MNKLITPEAFNRSTQASISNLVALCNHTEEAYRSAVRSLLSRLADYGHDVVVTSRGTKSALGPVEPHGPIYRVGDKVFTPEKVTHITEVNKYININIV